MDFYEKHRITILLVSGLIALALIVMYLGNMSIKNREALVNNAVRMSTESFTGADIVTNYGAIEITFLGKKAPRTVANFISLAQKDFYNGTKFHRVIKDFMIQGGDPNSKGDDISLYGRGGPGYAFEDEINNEPMVRGKIAMANSGPDTNGSQFFIITASETPWLNGKHTVFAEVTSGMNVVNEISAVQTGQNDIPVEPVIVEKVTLK